MTFVLGAILVKMALIHSTKIDFYENKLMNLEKLKKLYVHSKFLLFYSLKEPNIQEILPIQYFLLNRPILSEQNQKELAYRLEHVSISQMSPSVDLIRRTVELHSPSFPNSGAMQPSDWETILQVSTTQVFQENEVILKQGEYNSRLYRIKEGTVKIVQEIMVLKKKFLIDLN